MPSTVELLRFGNSGTECVQYALCGSHAPTTGRRLIVRFEGHYHGWSDAIHFSAQPRRPGRCRTGRASEAGRAGPGMPLEVAGTLEILPWNNPESVERLMAEHGDEIAAVITEPAVINGGGILPAPGYLERLRAETRRQARC